MCITRVDQSYKSVIKTCQLLIKSTKCNNKKYHKQQEMQLLSFAHTFTENRTWGYKTSDRQLLEVSTNTLSLLAKQSFDVVWKYINKWFKLNIYHYIIKHLWCCDTKGSKIMCCFNNDCRQKNEMIIVINVIVKKIRHCLLLMQMRCKFGVSGWITSST